MGLQFQFQRYCWPGTMNPRKRLDFGTSGSSWESELYVPLSACWRVHSRKEYSPQTFRHQYSSVNAQLIAKHRAQPFSWLLHYPYSWCLSSVQYLLTLLTLQIFYDDLLCEWLMSCTHIIWCRSQPMIRKSKLCWPLDFTGDGKNGIQVYG